MSSIPGAAWIKSKSAQLGVVPSKALGQNFMVDPHFLSHIASLAPKGAGRVLEVGPETWLQSLRQEDPLEKDGNPLQCSCLDNPRDRGAWWAAAQSRTQLT